MYLAGSPTHAPGRTQDLRPGLRALQCLTVWRPSRGGCVTVHGRPPLRSGPVSLEAGILVGVHRQGTGDGCSQYPWDDLATVRGRVDQGRCRPQPPTDPDVRVLPHPAPRRMASLRARGRVDGRHSRKRISREEAEKPLPGHRFLLRPTVEPLLPDVDDMKAARRQARGVPRNPVVGTVPPQLRHQHPMLLGNRRVAVHPAPAIHGRQGPPEAVLGRLSLEHPAAGPGKSPVVREPQNVERAGWWESVTVLPRAPTEARSAERDQTTLRRVHREAKAREAFRQHGPHPVGVSVRRQVDVDQMMV